MLLDPQINANALTWAAEAKKRGEVQTGTRLVPLVEGLNLARVGWLTGLEPATSTTPRWRASQAALYSVS